MQTEKPLFAVVVSEKGGAERRELFNRSELSVGRVQGNDIMLPKGNVSKRHARLVFRDGRYIVSDLNSTNGTYVNRRRISQATIVKEGDRIYIGDFVLRIEPAETEVADDDVLPIESSPPMAHAVPRDSEPSVRTVEPEPARSYPPLSSPRRLPPPPRALVESRPDAFPSSRRASTATASSSQVDLERSSIPALDRISTVERPTGEHELEPEPVGERDALADLVARVLKSGVDLPVDVDDRSRRAIEHVVAQELEAVQQSLQRGQALNLEALRSDALAELTELGPLGRLMADEAVTEISLPRYDQLTVVRQNRKSDLGGFSTPRTLELSVLRLCHVAGISPDADGVSRGKLQGDLEFEAMLSPALRTGPWLLVRKARRLTGRLESLVRSGVISRGMATFLQQATAARLRLLIVGSRGADAGQIVSALCAAAGEDRLVVVQSLDVFAAERAAVRLSLTEAAADAGSMVRALAHTANSRLVVDLAQTDVAVAALDAVAEGADGLIATTRAPNLRSAWSKLTADILTVRPQLPLAAAREWLASCFDLMLEVGQLRDGRVRVVRICEPGVDGTDVAEIFGFVAQRTAAGGLVEGTFTWSGHTPRAAQEMTARGFTLDSSVFARPATR